MAFLGALPFDMQAEIASHLSGPDLANLANAVPDFQPFFQKTVAPVFLLEFKRVAKIVSYLRKLFHYKPTTYDYDDHLIMSHVLDREVEEGEVFDDKIDYCVWCTLHSTLDRDPSMSQLVEHFAYEWFFPGEMLHGYFFLAELM
jgi:hypothetical protein